MSLTRDDIEEIVNELHMRVQFYDEDGKRNNRVMLARIADALAVAFGPAPGVTPAREAHP